MPSKSRKHPRFTYHLDREGCDDVWLITDNATGATLAGVRFWNDPSSDNGWKLSKNVGSVVKWLNAHAEEWMCNWESGA